MFLRVIGVALFVAWLTVLLLGKGGFWHLLFFNAVGVLMVDAVALYRSKLAKPI